MGDGMTGSEQLRQAIGLADACELVGAAFAFPDANLAAAFADGSFAADVRASLADAGAAADEAARACEPLASLAGRDPEGLLDHLRKGHSVLFLAPGRAVPVWPYESVFRTVASGKRTTPQLFVSPVTRDVEARMREAGALPVDAATEPVDSIWSEFRFLSFLLGRWAESLAVAETLECDGADVAAVSEALAAACGWRRRAASFIEEHLDAWAPAFFEAVRAEAFGHSHGAEYDALASFGMATYSAVRAGLPDVAEAS